MRRRLHVRWHQRTARCCWRSRRLGLTPADVAITEIGGQSARIAALEGGSCGAAPVDVNIEKEMTDQGFNVLINLKDAGLPVGSQRHGRDRRMAGCQPQYCAEHPRRHARGPGHHLVRIPRRRSPTTLSSPRSTQDTARAIVELTSRTIGNRSMIWVDTAFETPKEVLGTVNPDINEVPVDRRLRSRPDQHADRSRLLRGPRHRGPRLRSRPLQRPSGSRG